MKRSSDTTLPSQMQRSSRLRLARISAASVLSVALLGLIVLIVVYPLLVMLGDLIKERVNSVQPLFGKGGLDQSVLVVLVNTVVVVVGSSVIAVCIGSLLAWLNERTDGRLGVAGDFLPLAPLLVPTVAGVVAWLILLDPRIGYFNLIIRRFIGVFGITLKHGPFNILTTGGLIGLTAVHLVPLAYLVVSATLRRLDPSLEEASRVSGANIWRTFTRVTFPAIMPALASASLLCIIFGIGLFSVPLVIGTSAGIELLSVRIFLYISTGFPSRTDLAIVLAGAMLLTVQLLIYFQRRFVRPGRHATIGGRGFRTSRVELGRWRRPARTAAILYVLVTAVAPVVALLVVSFQPFWSATFVPKQFSLVNYATVLAGNSKTMRALITSFGLGVVGATVTMLVVGFLMLHAAHGGSARLRGWIDTVTGLPATIPHSVVGVSFLLAFALPPWSLYGTVEILLLAYIAMQLPYAARTAAVAASDIGLELGESSRVSGATQLRTFRMILLPLALPGTRGGLGHRVRSQRG